MPGQQGVRWDGEERTRTEEGHAQRGGYHRRARHGDEATGLPLEQEQLHREQRRGERSAEHGRHAAGRAGHEERLALGGREVERLREQRAEGAARHDDRPFGAERPAGADGDGRRQGLQNRHLERHPAAADENRFQRLGDTVAADALRAVPGHQTDDQAAGDGSQYGPGAEVIPGGRYHRDRDLVVVDEVRDEADEAHQRQRDDGTDGAHGHGHQRQQDNARVGREVGETVVGSVRSGHGPAARASRPSRARLRSVPQR